MSARQIATLLGRHHSVISREIARNGWEVVGEDGEATVYYNARQAGLGAKARAGRRCASSTTTRHFVLWW